MRQYRTMNVALQLRAVARPGAVAIWAVTLGFAYVVAGAAALLATSFIGLLLLEPLDLRPEAGTSGWGSYLAVTVLVWGGGAAAAGAWLGRRLVRGLAPERGRALGILVVGLVLSAATMDALHEFVRTRFVYFDPEHAGVALLAVPAMVGITLAAWARAALPPNRRWALGSVVLIASVGFVAATLPSLPGLADGVSPSGLILGACLAADAVFVGAMVVLGIVDAAEGPNQ